MTQAWWGNLASDLKYYGWTVQPPRGDQRSGVLFPPDNAPPWIVADNDETLTMVAYDLAVIHDILVYPFSGGYDIDEGKAEGDTD